MSLIINLIKNLTKYSLQVSVSVSNTTPKWVFNHNKFYSPFEVELRVHIVRISRMLDEKEKKKKFKYFHTKKKNKNKTKKNP